MPVQDLTDLPSGASIFVDTIIFDLHFKNKSIACSALISRIALRDVTAYVNTQVLSDLLHKSMLVEAYTKGLISSPNHEKLKRLFMRDASAAQLLTDYQEQVESILAFGIKVLSITRRTIIRSKHERQQHALMMGDSLHVHTMANHRITLQNISTHDSDLGNVNTLNVWVPKDVVKDAANNSQRTVSVNLANTTCDHLDDAARSEGRTLKDEIVWRLEQSVQDAPPNS